MEVSVVFSAARTKSVSLIQMFTCVFICFIHTPLPFSLGCASWQDTCKSLPIAVKKSYTGKLKLCVLDVVDYVVLTHALAKCWQWDKQVKNSSYLVQLLLRHSPGAGPTRPFNARWEEKCGSKGTRRSFNLCCATPS